MKRPKLSMEDGETTGQLILEGIVENISVRALSTERRNGKGEITATGDGSGTEVYLLIEKGGRETDYKILTYYGSLPKNIEGHWVRIFEKEILFYNRNGGNNPKIDRNFPMPPTRIQILDIDTNIPYH